MAKDYDDILDEHELSREFAVFEHFIRQSDMEGMAAILEAEGMVVRRSTDGTNQWREDVIMGQSLRPKYWLEVPEKDFARAMYVVREAAEEAWAGAAIEQHPFAEYDSAALHKILLEEDDYGIEAAVVARNLLLRRGEDLELRTIRETRRQQRVQKLRAREGSLAAIVAASLIGFAAGIFLSATILLAMLGVLLYYVTTTNRDQTGKKHYMFRARTRVRGEWGIGVVMLGLALGILNYFFVEWIPIEPVRIWYWLWR